MRKFQFTKLVRDKIVEGIISSGNKPLYRILSDKEYLVELKNKILEEAKELPIVEGEDLISELVDVQEVIDNLLEALNISPSDLKKVQEKKNLKNGSFKNRHYVDYVDVQNDSEWIDYYLSNPDKYPEIKE